MNTQKQSDTPANVQRLCACGCKIPVAPRRFFKQGHDQRLRSGAVAYVVSGCLEDIGGSVIDPATSPTTLAREGKFKTARQRLDWVLLRVVPVSDRVALRVVENKFVQAEVPDAYDLYDQALSRAGVNTPYPVPVPNEDIKPEPVVGKVNYNGRWYKAERTADGQVTFKIGRTTSRVADPDTAYSFVPKVS